MHADLVSRLTLLVESGEKARLSDPSSYGDEAPRLSPEKRRAWGEFLLSIATTESIENLLITPILEAFEGHPDVASIRRYLESQAADEIRHHGMLTTYVKSTFSHEKTAASLTDRVIYGAVLPGFAAITRARPVYMLTAIRFYEAFSLHCYADVRRAAAADGLSSLVALFQSIEKDEHRHLAGVQTLLHELGRREGSPGPLDRAALRLMLDTLRFDIAMDRWAVHNRRVRRNALAIGLDPVKIGRDSARTAREVLAS